MRLSENDIRALVLIAGSEEPMNPRVLLAELGLRRETVSRLLTHLEEKGLVERRGREVVLAGTPPAEAFKKLYYSHRASPLQKILSLQRMELLARLDQMPKSLEALAMETGIPSDTLYGYLKGFLRLGVVKRSKEGKAYRHSFNFILWSELKEFVTSLQEYQVLRLVPREALLKAPKNACPSTYWPPYLLPDRSSSRHYTRTAGPLLSAFAQSLSICNG
jgi:DNA-binding MarR family transcriptional regulator